MPKTTRSLKDIDKVKQKILKAALDIMYDQGFSALSMRNLASKLSMTAANIYNYYSNKDELYLAIQTRGFEMLYDFFETTYHSTDKPLIRLKRIIKAYLEFGIQHADYYDIMLGSNTPKYTDYIGTQSEPVAFLEKQTALKVADIATRVILEVIETNNCLPMKDARFRTMVLWSTLHGAVSLYNTRVLREVEEPVDEFIEKLAKELYLPFTKSKEN